MNHGTITGGVIEDALSARTPPTKEAPSIRRVLFKIATQDSRHGRSYWNCEAEGDDVTLDLIEAQAKRGCGVKLEFELCGRPYEKRGVHVGESRFLRVIRAEFNERHAPVEPVGAEA